jgi:hypothetical protein
MSITKPEQEFQCLNCGSTRCGAELQVGISYSGDNPWSYVAGRDVCSDCKAVLPRPLSRRWNQETYENARTVWLDKFKDSYPGSHTGA